MRLTGQEADGIKDVRLLLFFGVLGLAANIGSIMVLRAQSGDNMNMRAAFLEVVNDALGSVAVIVSAVVMMATGWDGFDAVAGGVIALMMIPRHMCWCATRCACCWRRRRPGWTWTRCARIWRVWTM